MGHVCKFEETLEIEDNQLVRIVYANWKDKRLDVLKQYENGEAYQRDNLYSNGYGLLVSFPNETMSYYRYGNKRTFNLEEYNEVIAIPNLWCQKINIDIEYLISKRPDLKYFFLKWNNKTSLQTMFELLKVWKLDNSGIEILMQKELFKVAIDKRISKLSLKRKKEIASFIFNDKNIETKDISMINLNAIYQCLKYKITIAEYFNVKTIMFDKFNYEVYKYLITKNVNYREYLDYIEMCKKTDHDINDTYWKYPTDFHKQHDKLMLELKNIEMVKKAEKDMALNKITKKFKSITDIKDLEIYLPNSIEDFSNQAKELNQCLITCNYPQKVIDENILICFIKEKGVPIATVEILPVDNNKITKCKKIRIGQFYGNELNRNDCKPNEKVVSAFNSWINGLARISKNKLIQIDYKI